MRIGKNLIKKLRQNNMVPVNISDLGELKHRAERSGYLKCKYPDMCGAGDICDACYINEFFNKYLK